MKIFNCFRMLLLGGARMLALLLIFSTLLLVSCFNSANRLPPGVKILNLSMSDDVRSMDPAAASDMLTAELLGHMFEGLLSFSYLGKPGQVEPLLATNLPRIDEKTRVVKFQIRRNVRFADDPAFDQGKGREIEAADFVYSFKRVADPRIGSGSWWMFSGMIEGLDEWREKIEKASTEEERNQIFDESVKGFSAPKKYELAIRLKQAYPQLLYVLSMVQTSVVAREVVNHYGADVIKKPVGTGPFRLKTWFHSSKIVLERNLNFREIHYPAVGSEADRLAGRLQSAAKPLPFLHEIHWDIIREEQPRWLKFMKGQLDITSIPRDSFSDVIAADGGLRKPYLEKGVRLHKELSLTTWWLEFNMKDPLVGKNVNLRKALAFAFDRVRALEILYNNRGVLASGPISPTYEGGQEAEKFPYSFDLEKAKEHLKLAGFAEGKGLPELVFDLRGSNSTQRQLGELLANNFLKIGVKLKLSGNSFQEALDKAKNSKFQIMLGGWHADYPDPENYLQLFVGSNQAPGPNTANFVSAEYDRLFKEMRVMSASKKRSEKIATMVAILNQELPVVFFFHAMDYFVVQGWVKNYRPHQLLYGTGRYFDLDLGNREKTLSEKY